MNLILLGQMLVILAIMVFQIIPVPIIRGFKIRRFVFTFFVFVPFLCDDRNGEKANDIVDLKKSQRKRNKKKDPVRHLFLAYWTFHANTKIKLHCRQFSLCFFISSQILSASYNCHDTDTKLSQIACHWQCHTNDGTFTCSICDLSSLTFIGSNTCCIDNTTI